MCGRVLGRHTVAGSDSEDKRLADAAMKDLKDVEELPEVFEDLVVVEEKRRVL